MSKTNKKIVKEEPEDDDLTELNEDTELDLEDETLYDDIDEDVSDEKEVAEDEDYTEEPGCAIENALDDVDDSISMEAENIKYVLGEDRISSNRLTKYEMVRILGERTKQLTMGAKPLIKNYQGLPYEDIAEEELKKNMIPFKIKRPLPNGTFELWTLDELNKDHLLSLL